MALIEASASKKKKAKPIAPPTDDALPVSEPKHYLDHLKKINDVFYDQIKTADQKAAYIFTFMLAFLITSAEGRGVFNWRLYGSGDLVAVIVSGVLALAVVATVVSAILVVLPRVRSEGTSLYWGGWANNRTAFIEASRTGDPDYLMREYLGNVDNLSAIARSKFRFVGLAFRSLVVTVLAYCLLLTLG
jgi:hypothetical protein